MVIPNSSSSALSKRSLVEVRAMNSTRSPTFWKAVTALAFVSLLAIYRAGDDDGDNGRIDKDEDNLHKFYAQHRGDNPLERCIDADDPQDWMPSDPEESCLCGDPAVPRKRRTDKWMHHHEELVEDAERAATEGTAGAMKRKNETLDFVFVGDSIVERWMGTEYLGQFPLRENKYSFRQFFDKSTGVDAKLSGMALGTAGDTSTNLLWQLQNGLIPDGLEPKAWIILIGTNDLGNKGCSKRNTLAGILHVAQYLSGKRRKAQIIVHGLLPRGDRYNHRDGPDYTLGKMWKQIMWINRELRRFCMMQDNWHYVESGGLFVQKIRPSDPRVDTQGAREINPLVMKDGLHPTYNGYQAWGPELVGQITKILNRTSAPSSTTSH